MLVSSGDYTDIKNGKQYNLIFSCDKYESVMLVGLNGQIISAYKKSGEDSWCFNNKIAKDIYDKIYAGMRYCTAKNQSPSPFELGIANRYMFERSKINYTIEKFNDDVSACEITSENFNIVLTYKCKSIAIPEGINWVPLTKSKVTPKTLADEFLDEETSKKLEEDIPVRTLEEIGLEKDTTWLEKKQYFIVNDEKTYDTIISAMEKYVKQKNSPVAFDTETSGLFINMFGKIGSDRKKQIEARNKIRVANGETPYKVDTLTGFILTIQPNISYYFPCRNRKFKNLYQVSTEDHSLTPEGLKYAQNLKATYTIGEYKDRDDDMAHYIKETPVNEIENDVLAMERIRWLLTHANIVTHNGIFDWKVAWLYNIDTNICDDTMVMHKMLYKFNDMSRGNLGERSDLKYLTWKHFGVDQLELADFFVNYKDDSSGIVIDKSHKKKKKAGKVDFSYMDYKGAEAYAPADGDFTLQLFLKFKKDLIENHSNLEYLYKVEIIMTCAIAYMEFYGHRIDPDAIERTKIQQQVTKLEIEAEFRKVIGYSDAAEDEQHEILKKTMDDLDAVRKEVDNEQDKDKKEELKKERTRLESQLTEDARKMQDIIDNSPKVINLGSPAQVTKLFFEDRKIPFKEGEKPSVGKKVLKAYQGIKEDGKEKYPEIGLYRKWKDIDTLLTKFFDNLDSYMYDREDPVHGGFIFSTYGQISTATGRMSCSHPNAQQYPHSITAIVKPRENCIMLDADFSQIEYRTLTALAHEEGLLNRFKDPDMDYHTTMASLMYGVPYANVTSKMRKDAKSFNFGIPYGMGFGSLAILLTGNRSKASIEEAKEKYELYFKNQPNVKKYFVRVKEKAKFNGYTETLWHRTRKYNFLDKDGKYSQAKEAQALRQAGNAVIQGTAADIFKIAAARTFSFIRENNLYGKFYVINMIHDEQLTEIDVSKLNPKKMLSALVQCMELKLDGFPPLYVGAGIGMSWDSAKGKMAEEHPLLAEQFIKEAENEPMYLDKPWDPKEAVDYFNKRVKQFRVEKITAYIKDPKNWGQAIHPVIGNLLNLQFDFGVKKELEKEYTKENGYTDDQIKEAMASLGSRQIEKFIETYNLDVDPKNFYLNQNDDKVDTDEDEEDEGYDDADEVDEDGTPIEVETESKYKLLDDSNAVYGVDIRDIIRQFGILVSTDKKICGINTTVLKAKTKDDMADYLSAHKCDQNDDGAMEVVYLKDNNTLFHSYVFVKGVNNRKLGKVLNINN